MTITPFDAMNDALQMCSDLGLEMVPGFATHWPMGAETMIRLGYPEVVHEWAQRYHVMRKHYPRAESHAPIDARDPSSWKSARGSHDRVGDWQGLFERELSARPWREVLVEWWPRLMPGVAAGLTHGLIRTTHAVRSIAELGQAPTPLQLRELASGLAYWASKYREQPGQAALFGNERLPELLAAIPRLSADGKSSLRDRGLFVHIPDIEGWPAAVSRLAAPTDMQSALSDMTLSFAQANLVHSDQFPVPFLHAVTAPAALRIMLPHVPEAMHLPSFIAIWQVSAALLATFAPVHRPAEVSPTAPDQARATLSTTELAQQAVEHGDEHVMKITEACTREYAIRPDDRYLLLAESMLGKIPRYFRGGPR
jgi:hypothetical protein